MVVALAELDERSRSERCCQTAQIWYVFMLAWPILWPCYNLKRMRLLNEYVASECGPVNIQAVSLSWCHFEICKLTTRGVIGTLFFLALSSTLTLLSDETRVCFTTLCWICFQSETHIALCWGPFPKWDPRWFHPFLKI